MILFNTWKQRDFDVLRREQGDVAHREAASELQQWKLGQVKSVKTAWENLRLRIYGHPVTRLANGKLAPCCRAKLAAINLHLHDLRRESGSVCSKVGSR